MAAQIHDYEIREKREWEGQAALSQNGSERSDDSNCEDVEQEQVGTSTPEDDRGSDGNKENDDDAGPGPSQEENDKLLRMGINTAVAIGLHNFPEGLATFVAALSDPGVGGVLAIAIALHNIPEGLCVAMPIYYATGNRWKAFGWAALSGASELLGAFLGWAILANSFSDTMYAVLFGLVAGMMVIISVRELLPTAHRYDPDDTVVTYSFIVGMAIMAFSLVLMTFYE
jgi:ZIP family zinc transporter